MRLEEMFENQKFKKLIAILLASLFILVIINIYLPSLEIISKYQTPRPVFYAVVQNGKVSYDNKPADFVVVSKLGGTLTYQIFLRDKYKLPHGTIAGEMTSLFFPDQEPNNIPNDFRFVRYPQPYKTYKWNITRPDGYIELYAMYEYILYWFFTFAYTWSGNAVPGAGGGETETQWCQAFYTYCEAKRYRNVFVWWKIDLRNVWYFEGQPNDTRVGLAKMVLIYYKRYVDKTYSSDGRGPDQRFANNIMTTPSAIGSYMPISDTFMGKEESDRTEKFTSYYYRGVRLNPNVFRPDVYTYVVLNNFGPEIDNNPPLGPYNVYGDAVAYGLQVHVFVVGTWVVKDYSSVPQDYGKPPQTSTSGSLLDFLKDPFFKYFLILILILIIGLIAIVIIFVFGIGLGGILGRKKE
jgi:hypothetical protein